MTAAPALAVVASGRVARLDALRGFAIVCMVVDHLAFFAHADSLRLTVGRLALPVFFLLAGHLSRRLSPRLLWVLAAGIWLPLFAPWVDSPNVLVWVVAGALLLAGSRALGVTSLPLLVVCLTLLANPSLVPMPGTSYPPAALVAMMALGAFIPRESFAWAANLPAGLAFIGRYPLSFYCGHVLLLTVLVS